VTDTIPTYLRIHRGPDTADPSPADLGRDAIADFWLSYSEATQWRIDPRSGTEDVPLDLLPVVSDSISQEPVVAVGKSSAQRLAESALELASQLESSRQALRSQEAELAARAAILGGSIEQKRLADRLEQTLADVATACGCSAAAMYLLDDDTEILKTRSVSGLPASRLETASRSLRGSRADLEAMVQGVVAIDDLNETSIDTWNCPESTDVAASAICAVITSDDVPVGTLWIFHNQTSQFGPAQAAAARMAAAQLSLHLHLALVPCDQSSSRHTAVAQDVADWQCESLPSGTALSSDWSVDGMIESPQAWATGWHAWDVLPDGSLMFAIAEAMDPTVKGAMTATIARAAMTSHIGYHHTPSQLLQRVNDTLWQTSTCEQLMSMLYVRVDPETGEGEFASAGAITAMIGSQYGYRPLVDGRGDPLCSDFRASFATDTFRLMPAETLLAYSPGMQASGANQMLLGDSIRSATQQQDKSPLATIRRRLAGMPLVVERGAATLSRGH
jgi:sigma-B regulation protein RsbU (phosphoserine phosphatase)